VKRNGARLDKTEPETGELLERDSVLVETGG
jgi:hypothetical protein